MEMTEVNVRDLSGCRALFSKEDWGSPDIVELKVIEVTPKYVKIQHLGGAFTWMSITEFTEVYEFLENLPGLKP